jgi:uncharacterized protein (DUF2141 family)
MNTTGRWLASVGLIVTLWLGGAAAAQEEFATRDMAACMLDGIAHCSDVAQGGGRIVKCLQQHRADLSDECKAAVTPRDPGGELTVTVSIEKISNPRGVIIIGLVDDPAAFPRGARRTWIVPAAGATVAATFRHLKPGSYAVTALHDENENGVPDAGEGRGVSNPVAKPEFASSAVKVDGHSKVSVPLFY